LGARIAIAALLALSAWLPSLARLGASVTTNTTVTQSDPVELVATWAEAGRVPSNVDLVQTLGGLNDR
jgi:hypothetical protein